MFFASAFVDVVFRRPPRLLPPAPTSAPPKLGTRIHFRLLAPRVHPRHTVYVCGECEELGAWDPSDAVPMRDDEFPLWSAVVDVRPTTPLPVQYKYVLRERRDPTADNAGAGSGAPFAAANPGEVPCPTAGAGAEASGGAGEGLPGGEGSGGVSADPGPPPPPLVWEDGPNRVVHVVEVPAHSTPPAHTAPADSPPPSASASCGAPAAPPRRRPHRTAAVHVTDNAFRHGGQPWKGAGVTVPVASMRSHRSLGVGDFGDLKLCADVAAHCGLKLIQLLPVHDTTIHGDDRDINPFRPLSVFALHPLYTCVDAVPDMPPTWAATCAAALPDTSTSLQYKTVLHTKLRLLRVAFAAVGDATLASPPFRTWVREHGSWVRPYALFCAMRDVTGTVNRAVWPVHSSASARRIAVATEPGAPTYRAAAFWMFVQYLLHTKLRDAVQHAADVGVVIKGDVPVGVAPNGVDVWLEPHLFSTTHSVGESLHVCMFVCMFVCLFVCLFVCMFVCLFVCLLWLWLWRLRLSTASPLTTFHDPPPHIRRLTSRTHFLPRPLGQAHPPLRSLLNVASTGTYPCTIGTQCSWTALRGGSGVCAT